MSLKINSINTSSFMHLIMYKKTAFSSDTSKFYRINNEPGFSTGVLKLYSFEKLPQNLMPIYQDIWPREIIDAANKTDFDELLKVLELIVVDRIFRGHITESVDSSYIDFDDCLRKDFNITAITERFKRLNKLLEKGIARDVVFPDLMTKGNLKINPQTNELKVFDLEGLQVNKRFAFAASDLLGIEENEAFGNLYIRTTPLGVYLDPKINRAILLIYYIKSLTNICLPLTLQSKFPNGLSAEIILNALGLKDDDLLAPFIRQTMVTGDIDEVPNELLDEFSKKYTLKNTMYANEAGRVFEKR